MREQGECEIGREEKQMNVALLRSQLEVTEPLRSVQMSPMRGAFIHWLPTPLVWGCLQSTLRSLVPELCLVLEVNWLTRFQRKP